MKNINWSKWIAIALSIFIVTQFIQVSFLAARRFGGNAGGDATEASGVAGIYEGLLGAVGEDNGLVMSAKAAGEVTATLTGVSESSVADPIDLVSKNYDGSTDFTISLSVNAGDLTLISDSPIVTFSEHFTVADVPTTAVGGELSGSLNYEIDGNVVKITGTGTTDAVKTGTITVSGVTFNNANLPDTADTTTGTGSVTVDSTEYRVLLPAKNVAASTVTTALTTVDGNAAASPIDLVSKTYSGNAGFVFTVNATAGSLAGVNSETVVTFSDHFNVTDAASAAVSGDLSGNLNYQINGNVIKITGSGTITEGKTGTITVLGVTFNNANLPDTADTTTGTGSVTVDSTTYQVKLPAKNVAASTVTTALTTVDGNAAASPIDLVSKTYSGDASFVFTVNATAGSLAGVNSETVVTFSDHFNVTDAASAAVSGDLSGNLNYQITGNVIKITGSGTITEGKTGTITVSGVTFNNANLPAVADTATGTGSITVDSTTYQVKLPAKNAGVTNSITVKRKLVTKAKGGSETETNVDISGTAWGHTLYNSSKAATGNAGAASGTDWVYSGLADGTYYVGETTTPATHSVPGAATYTNRTNTSETAASSTDGYWPIAVSKSGTTPDTAVLTLKSYRPYTIRFVDGSGTAIENESLPITAAAGNFWQNGSATTQPWTTAAEASKFNKVFVDGGGPYTIAVPTTAGGSTTVNVTFSIDATGVMTVTDTGSSVIAASVSGDNALTIVRGAAAVPGTVSVQLVDNTTNAAIPQSGVRYKLAEYTATNPTGTETAETQVPTTNASGVMTVSVPVPASGSKKYYLTETTYPTGYRANNTTSTKIYYTFSIDDTGAITYTTNTDATDKGWAVTPTGGVQKIKYTTDTQEQLSIQLKDSRGTVYKLGSAFDLYTAATGTTKVDGAVVSVSDTGLITSTGLPSVDTATTIYLGETTAPTGYVAKTSRFAITVKTDGTLEYPPSGDLQRITSGTGATLTYVRKDAVLTLNRAAATSDPATLTYELHKNATASDASSGTITLTKSGTTFTGASTASLDWNTDYYVKETTADYAGKDGAIHGPFSFSPTMSTSGTTPEGTAWTAVPADMTMTATLVPATTSDPTFVLNRTKGSTTEAANGAQFSVRGVFSGSSAETEKTFTTGSDGRPTTAPTGFLTGKTYTVTETTVSASGYTKVIFTFTNTSSTAVTIGTVTGGKATASGKTINMTETFGSVKFKMEVCTAEQGDKFEDRVDDDAETVTAAGFAFYLYSDSDARTKITDVYNASGTKLSNISTNSSGEIEIYGLSDATYYLKYAGTISDSDAKKATAVDADTKSIFKFTVTNGTITSEGITKSNDTGNWRARRGRIRAYLKEGSIKLTAGSDKSYYVYRLYSGSDRAADDNRSEAKMNGKTKEFTADEKKNFIKVAGLDDLFFEGLKFLDSLFTLKAYAAEDAKTITYPKDSGTTWELIGSVQPGKGNTSDLSGLIAGQVYLIREGDSESAGDSDGYYLATPTASGKTLATSASAANTANTANTARTTNGTGTANSGSKAAGGARGSATGDAGDLWRHLIIMLIAFDALVADLLYMSRKKQRVIRRR